MADNSELAIKNSDVLLDGYNHLIARLHLNTYVFRFVGGAELGEHRSFSNRTLQLAVDDKSTLQKRKAVMQWLLDYDKEFDVVVFQNHSTVVNLRLLDILLHDHQFEDNKVYGGVMSIQNRGMDDFNSGIKIRQSFQLLVGNLHIMTRKTMEKILPYLDYGSTWTSSVLDKWRIFTNPTYYKAMASGYKNQVTENHLPGFTEPDDDIITHIVVSEILNGNFVRLNSKLLEGATNVKLSDMASIFSVRVKMESSGAWDLNEEWYWKMREVYEPYFIKFILNEFENTECSARQYKNFLDLKKEYPVPESEATEHGSRLFDIWSEPWEPDFDVHFYSI
jgi:hypothetical protein